MNRYFLDLVLEQVRRGNMTDQALRKQVWAHMTALFNEKCGFQYDKDILKNRFKSLRRKYNEITTLLNNGFQWDRTMQMVVADDNMWDTYVKAHPDARSYRTKITPFYDDLCMIYGGSPIDEKVTNMGHDEDMEDDSSSEMSGETPAIEEDPAYDIENSSHADEEGLLQRSKEGTEIAFCEVENMGHSSETSNQQNEKVLSVQGAFATEGWSSVVLTGDAYRTRVSWTPPMDRSCLFGRTFSKEAWMHMIALFSDKFGAQYDKDVLYNRFKNLRKQYVCIRSLLTHGGFEWDTTLQMVKADVHVWDDYVKAHPDVRQYRVRPVPHYKDCVQYMVHNKRLVKSPTGSGYFKKLKNTDQSMIDAILEMASAITSNLDGMAALRALPDIDEELFLDACDFLEVDANRAKTFVVLDASLRKKWLERKLRSS
ncbi:hypothetical protein C5167_007881 [Papaver somniferum]|nr:hypothetical protein C5167_007881 [Papaver somniferum]